jgi:NitT/TauT family transport system substrate-binding protein
VRALVLTSAALGLAAGGAQGADRLLFKTDFPPVGYHATYYAAAGNGLYDGQGLAVDILPGTGSHSAVLDTAAGKVDVALADASTFVLAALNGNVRNVKMIGVVYEVTPYTVLYLRNKGISRPQDLAGKTMATFQGSGPRALFRAFARANNFDAAGVKELIGAPATFLNALVVGQADFAPTTTNLLPVLRDAARQAGNELAEFRFVDHGLDLYGAALIANVQTIQQRGDVLRRFVRATLQSLQATARDPETSLEHLVRRNPQLLRDKARVDLKTILEVSVPRATTAPDPASLGWIDEGKLMRTVDRVREAYGLSGAVDLRSLYTNEYVTKP